MRVNVGVLRVFLRNLQVVYGPDAEVEIRHGNIVSVRNVVLGVWGVYDLSDAHKTVRQLRDEMGGKVPR